MTMHGLESDPLFADPREVLRQVVTRFIEMELTTVTTFELEFYLIDQGNANGQLQPLRSSISNKRPQSVWMCSINDLDEYIRCLQGVVGDAHAQGIPADAIVAESAPAQFEVSLHRVAGPMKACDCAIPFKRLVKSITYSHGMGTTFMAKPCPDQTGSGLHVHISLLSKHGSNILTSENPEQNAILCYAIGGVLETLSVPMVLLYPNVNSYRHFGPQSYVPNASSWDLDNCTMILCVPTGSPDAVRPEHRVAGVDASPYLLLASMLAGVHHRPTNRAEPSIPIESNSYERLGPSLPNSLRNALRELDDNETLARYIGPKYVDIFVACKKSELEKFEYSIFDLEYSWYLHTI